MEKLVVIRTAVLSDIPQITKLWIQLMEHHVKMDAWLYRFKINRAAIYKKFLRKRIKENKSAVFVA